MLKKLLIIVLVFGASTYCSSKKKGLPLFLLMLGGGGTTGSTDSVSATPATIDSASNGSGFTVVPLDSPAPTAGSTGTTPPEVFVTPTGPTQVLSQISFQVLNDTFLWDNSISTNIYIKVSNEDGALSGITVKVSEDQTTPGFVQFLSQGITGADGKVTIRISVRPSVSEVIVTVYGTNPKNGQAQEISGRIPIQVPSQTSGGGNSGGSTGNPGSGGGTVVVAPNIDLSTVNFGGVGGCLASLDSDCDGVLDEDDEFPTDSTLGWTDRSGRYTLAWEDYYQAKFIQNGTKNPNNDMDLNDHVTVFNTEIDYSPTGKAKAIRGVFTHVGKGAGFNHDLRLSLDVPSSATFSITYIGNDGKTIASPNCSLALSSASNAGDCLGGTLTPEQLKKGILIFPNSRNTLYNAKNAPNVGSNLNFVLGMTAKFTLTFSEAVDLGIGKNLSGGHFNYFLAVSGTGERIYRPGFYKSTGENPYDLYIDRMTGFPFGVIVPGVFNFPREIVNILDPKGEGKTGYPAFKEWASSKGTLSRNWFEQSMTTSQKAYVVDIKSNYATRPFTAILIDSVSSYAWELAFGAILVGLLLGYLFRNRLIQAIPLN
jgi:LruC domain-containing protein